MPAILWSSASVLKRASPPLPWAAVGGQLLLLSLGLLACPSPQPISGPAALPFISPPSTGPFTDVTQAWGLDAPQATEVAGFENNCAVAHFMTAAVAVADVNADGWLDLYLPRSDLPDRLMINQGGQGFEDHAMQAGLALTEAGGGSVFFDRDGDGDQDLLRTSPAGPPRMFDNDGSGVFTEVPNVAGVIVSNIPAAGCARMFGASLADIDGDGDLDLLTAAWEGSPRSRLFENDGRGYFEDITEAWGLDLDNTAVLVPTFLDLDADGDLDLLAVADFDETRVYENVAQSNFRDITATSTLARIHDGMGVDLGDIDGDGDFDLFVSGICFARRSGCLDTSGWTGNQLFERTVTGFEVTATATTIQNAGWAWGATFFDPDLDGDLDLAVSNGYGAFLEFERTPTQLFENDGQGGFRARSEDWGIKDAGQGRAVLAFDMDGDGDDDLLVIKHGAPPVLYRNDMPAVGAHLRVYVSLGAMNPKGIGAEVRLRGASGPTIVRQITANSRFGAHAVPVALFGGLESDQSYEIEVWVSGVMKYHAELSPLPASGQAHIEL